MKAHVVLVCPEPIRPLQQGVGIRFREMARELSREHRVSLWAPNADAAGDGTFAVVPFPDGDFRQVMAGVDAVVIHGHVSDRYLDALEAAGLGAGPPLVVDLYDPFLVENLQYTAALGDGIYRRDLRVLTRQLAAGDLFLVSSERQRAFYTGVMMAAGLFDPALHQADPTLDRLFAVAPFGVRPPAMAAVAGRRWKGVVPGLAADDLVVVFGGLYDWYNPDTLLDAAEQLCDAHPALRIVFSANPNPDSTPQIAFARARADADRRGLTDRVVFFLPWFPYDERDAYLADADVAVCLHRPSLEADLSLRTRVLDFLRAGLPVVATRGGDTETLLANSGGGVLVPPMDAGAVVAALGPLLTDRDRRTRVGEAGRAWVLRERPWSRTLLPLTAFCAAPWKRSLRTASLTGDSSPRPGDDRSGNDRPGVDHGGAGDAVATRGQVRIHAEPEYSVIVPTHNRRALLAEVLAALDAQADAPRFEVVVVDDGSRDDTPAWLARHAGGSRVRALARPHRGAAAARNAGVEAARGRLVAFLGDDTVPAPRWLARHHACHRAARFDPLLAVIGRVGWHARVRVTPFLRYINEQGKQFGWALIRDPRDLPFNFFYTSNASLHRERAAAEPFDERFPYAAWEDTEFAYRLKRGGLRIDYEAEACVAHDHPTTIGRFMQRQERVGYSAVIFHARHPELGPFLGLGPDGPPPDTRTWRDRLIHRRVRALDRLGISSPEEWDEILRLSYLGGLHRGWRSLRQAGGGLP